MLGEIKPVMLSKQLAKECPDRTSNITDKRSPSGGPLSDLSASDKSIITINQRTDAIVRGLLLILEHHCVPKVIQEHLENQMHTYLDNSCSETVWLKRCKYVLTYPLAKYLRNELPPPPDQVFEPKGALRVWMRSRFNAFNRRNTHLWYSWFQAKRSTLPVSDDIVDETYEKHFQTLTKRDYGDDDVIDEIFSDSTFMNLLRELRQEITENYLKQKEFIDFAPSKSACFTKTRSQGGQQDQLLDICGLTSFIKRSDLQMDCDIEDLPYYLRKDHISPPPYGHLAFTELHHMRFDPVVFATKNRNLYKNRVTEVRCHFGSELWGELRTHANNMRCGSPLDCTIQAVLEPNKVRVISKGEALQYYSCRPLQRAMHDALRHRSCFRLIGKPFSPTDLIDLRKKAKSTDLWFSIDWSAATDSLSWKYSGRIFRFLCDDLPDRDRAVALDVLGPHNLWYPTAKGGKVFRGIQQNGQLMGSILSFPILCLANLGVYLVNTKISQKGWTHKERLDHVLVNGDDMIYAADESLWQTHVEFGKKVGLEMSVGKAYCHREYCNINSVSAHYALHRDSYPYRIDYLNAGLYFGQHKVQNKDARSAELEVCSNRLEPERLSKLYADAHMSQNPADGLCCNLNVLMEGCLPGRQSALLSNFLIDHADELRKECVGIAIRYTTRGKRSSLFTRNIFLPLSVGGMGVNPPPGFKFKIKPIDRQVAHSLSSGATLKTSQFPLPGYELTKLDEETSDPWFRKEEDDQIFSITITTFKASKRVTRLGYINYGPNHLSVIS